MSKHLETLSKLVETLSKFLIQKQAFKHFNALLKIWIELMSLSSLGFPFLRIKVSDVKKILVNSTGSQSFSPMLGPCITA